MIHTVPNRKERVMGKTVRERIVDPNTGEIVAEANQPVDEATAERLESLLRLCRRS